MYRLYDYLPSGNGYKIRLLLTQLKIPFERIEVNILEGESRTPEFLAKNPDGRIPVLEIEPGVFLSQSNAILFYLSEGTPFLPNDPLERQRVLEWLFWEQNLHEPSIATSRFWLSILKITDERQEAFKLKQQQGYAALAIMEKHLSQYAFFVGERYTIVDIALYAYTHVAHEGGFDLNQFPSIQGWMTRVQSQPNHIVITNTCHS